MRQYASFDSSALRQRVWPRPLATMWRFILRQITARSASMPLPELVHVATPSYCRHARRRLSGDRILALVNTLAQSGTERTNAVNVLPGIVSPADLRYLKELFRDFGLEAIFLPDYSQHT